MIGRNEGARLRRAIEFLGRQPERCVYVDSGSSDGSVAFVRSYDIPVIELDPSIPFTAARGRNEGFALLTERWPDLEFVHFLDGDCVLDPEWLPAAVEKFRSDPKLAVVTGFLREIRRDASVYNRLCDIEWEGPVGEIQTCGGIAMMRAAAYREVSGMNPTLIAGEEADLHIRMRERGWKLCRIPKVMAYHDADLTEFRQWWKRNVRAGHACAEGLHLHGNGPERFKKRESRSNWFWGLALPGTAAALVPATLGLSSLLVAVGYPALYARILRAETSRGRPFSDAEVYARYTVLGKVPQAVGQVMYHVNRWRNRRAGLYEYKKVERNPGGGGA